MSGDDPEQTENTDAIKGGVGLSRDGQGGSEDTLGGSLKGEHVEEMEQKESRRTPRTLMVICQRYSIYCTLKTNISPYIDRASCEIHYYFVLPSPLCPNVPAFILLVEETLFFRVP